MTWVVDASVALKWVLPEEDGEAAHDLLRQPVIAPDWWLVEAGNGLWKAVGRGEITAAQALGSLENLKSVPVTSVDGSDLLVPALSLACDLKHPIYDCLYLALAVQRGVGLVTADDRFLRLVSRSSDLAGRVVSLGGGAWR